MARLIDANLLIRYFTQDDPKKAQKIQDLFRDLKQTIILPDIIVAETAWTLSSYYRFDRDEIATRLASLLNLPNLELNRELITRTIWLFRNLNISFIDAYLSAYCEIEKLEGIYSYDKDFNKIPQVKRFEP